MQNGAWGVEIMHWSGAHSNNSTPTTCSSHQDVVRSPGPPRSVQPVGKGGIINNIDDLREARTQRDAAATAGDANKKAEFQGRLKRASGALARHDRQVAARRRDHERALEKEIEAPAGGR